MKQADIVKQLSSAELKKSVLYTQLILFGLSLILSLFLFNTFTDWFNLFKLNMSEIFYYGVIPAIIVVLINIILDGFIPKHYLDDGGINEKLFSGQSIFSIFIIAATVAIAEELLFRGVIQSSYGYVFASSLFALIHIRYLKKPVLLVAVVGMSFYIGYLYEITHNLNVTITAHFLIDFILGLLIKYKTRGERNG
ncbi:MAG TPA: CPBP family intramembrane glutamic endopeptidase [Pseudogracilibacillus sp.]|nr:CPBP family intramembrane glutamic endopeptidase [Pseudogracilibacillus sp.]